MNKLRHDESGLVSIIVAIVLVTLIALITTSFALLSRRETRQALDRQLSTQAFYAAESGVNDAIQYIGGDKQNITECSDAADINDDGPGLGNNLSYTCVLIEENPTSLVLDPVKTETSKIVRVQAEGAIGSIRISWQDTGDDPSDTFAKNSNSDHKLPQAAFNLQNPASFGNHTGIVRAQIVPVTNNINRQSLIQDTQNLFLYPLTGDEAEQAGSYTYQQGAGNITQQGQFVDGMCNTGNISGNFPYYCNVDIDGLQAAGTNTFYIRLIGYYQPSKVVIRAFAPGGEKTDSLTLYNGQAVIDATGKANDVLRRIQVRVPVLGQYAVPDFAFESIEDICKQITVTTTTVNDACASNYVD